MTVLINIGHVVDSALNRVNREELKMALVHAACPSAIGVLNAVRLEMQQYLLTAANRQDIDGYMLHDVRLQSVAVNSVISRLIEHFDATMKKEYDEKFPPPGEKPTESEDPHNLPTEM